MRHTYSPLREHSREAMFRASGMIVLGIAVFWGAALLGAISLLTP
jgi:hypothetical protein